jgi:hypothetical protein
MKLLLSLIICVLVALTAGNAQAREDTLFPEPDEINNDKPSLDTAIAQFEGIIENSAAGDMASLNTNDKYNQQRLAELEQQLAAKKEYVATIPEIVSRQFDALMRQYADSDQKTKNKMADDLHAKWKARELRVKREVTELEEQLMVTTDRVSEAAMKRQMLDISSSLAQSEKALGQRAPEDEDDPNAESLAFRTMRDISSRRILSKIRGFCPIRIKPLHAELSIKYLDN